MNRTINTLFGILSLTALVSCEEIIDLDLGNAEPRIVIEGTITSDTGPYYVKINQSVDYGELNEFPTVSGAAVTIKDQDGNSEMLEEVEQGLYAIQEFQGEPGKRYELDVTYDGESYKAASTMPATVIPIQSLDYVFEEETLFIDEGYYVTAYFADPEDEMNYYRLKMFVNGEPSFCAALRDALASHIISTRMVSWSRTTISGWSTISFSMGKSWILNFRRP